MISEKLVQIAENVPLVYEAGRQSVIDQMPESSKDSVSGETLILDDVSSIEHVMTVSVSSKNLIPYPYEPFGDGKVVVNNGITFTDNGDTTVTANGTATGIGHIYVHYEMAMPAGTYKLTGCPAGGGWTTWLVGVDYVDDTGTWVGGVRDLGSGAIQTFSYDTTMRVGTLVFEGNTVTDLLFKPKFEKVVDYSTITLTRNEVDFPVNADGTVSGVTSVYPTTILSTNSSDVVINCDYMKDMEKAILEGEW